MTKSQEVLAFIIRHSSWDKARVFLGDDAEGRGWAWIRASFHDIRDPLTDAEWQELLDGNTLPDGTDLSNWDITDEGTCYNEPLLGQNPE